MTVKIEVHGIPEARVYLKKQNKLKIQQASDAIKQATLYVEGEVKQSIAGHRPEPKSVDTGRFLQSVHSTSNAMEGKIISDVNYAQFLEFGTSKLSARRHFQNSLERNRNKIRDFIKNKLGIHI